MADLVVTVPKDLWPGWIAEGDAAGQPESGTEWAFWIGGGRPPIEAGDRLYIVAHGRLRGYAHVTRVMKTERSWGICRCGGAVACTLDVPILGFRGWRKVWWKREEELPFPDWKTAGVS